MKNGRGNLSTCNIFFLITNNSKYVQVFFLGCIIPAVKRVIYFWRHFITVLNMNNSCISLNLANVKYTSLKTISFYCIFTHTEYLSYIWSPLHLKSVKTISLYWRLYLYIIIRFLKSVTCDLFVLVVTWMQTKNNNIDQGIHKYRMCPYCYTVCCPSHCNSIF